MLEGLVLCGLLLFPVIYFSCCLELPCCKKGWDVGSDASPSCFPADSWIIHLNRRRKRYSPPISFMFIEGLMEWVRQRQCTGYIMKIRKSIPYIPVYPPPPRVNFPGCQVDGRNSCRKYFNVQCIAAATGGGCVTWTTLILHSAWVRSQSKKLTCEILSGQC